MSEFASTAGSISNAAIPLLFLLIVGVGFMRGVKVYETFIEGAKEGFETAVRIIPYLVGVLVCVAMVRAAGLLDVLARLAGPVLGAVGVPPSTLK